MRCVSYTRAVSNRPSMSGTQTESIMAQNQRIQDFTKAHGWKIEKKYSDRKKDGNEETAFLEMKADGMARKFDCVVIDSLYLCGKKMTLAADLFSLVFLPAGIHFAVVEDNIVSSEMDAKDAVQYLQKRRSEYRIAVSTVGATRRAEMRQYPKYGYRYNGEQMELLVEEETAAVVREIYKLAVEGNGAKKIMEILNGRGTESPHEYFRRLGWPGIMKSEREGKWNISEIKKILANRLYVGEWERTVGGEKVIVPCPPIIDREVFQIVDAKRAKDRRFEKNQYGSQTIFTKKIFDQGTGIPLCLHTHNQLQVKIYRMTYPKPSEVSYEKSWILFSEVEEQVVSQLMAELKKAAKAVKMISSDMGMAVKEQRIRNIREEAQNVFEKMLLLEEQGRVAGKSISSGETAADIVSAASESPDNIDNDFWMLDQKLKAAEEQIAGIEKTFSRENPWIKIFSDIDLSGGLTRKIVNKAIERIECVRFEFVEVRFCEQKWFRKLPGEWF